VVSEQPLLSCIVTNQHRNCGTDTRRLSNVKGHPKKAIVFTIILALATAITAFAQDAPSTAIRVNGAAISSEQVQLWAKSFMEANAVARIIVTGSSAGKGFEALSERHADIAIASRVISSEEGKKAQANGIELRDCLVGYSGIAVITAPKNPISELSLSQLKKIFLGEYTNWNQVGGPDSPIRCLTRRVPESGAAVFFQEKVLEKQPFGPTTAILESWSSIIRICSSAADSPIGIAPIFSARAAEPGIKVIGVKQDEHSVAVKPSDETLKQKTYPIILPFRFYWDQKTLSSQAKQFVDYCAAQGLGSQK
jgi:phosphate transport system substrate-binding protein